MANDVLKPEVDTSITNYGVKTEKLDSTDAVIPSIYLMQAMSQWVTDEKAKPGDFVKSGTQQIIGSAKEPFYLVPLAFTKSFRIVEAKGNKWVRNEPFNPAKSDEWEFTENGLSLKRIKCINVLGFIAKDLAAEKEALEAAQKSGEMFDLDKALKPVAIQFRSSSFKSAKIITDHFVMAEEYKSFGAQPYSHIFEIGAHKETNDDGTFFVMDVKRDKAIDKQYLGTCRKWRELILRGNARVDESAENDVIETTGQEKF